MHADPATTMFVALDSRTFSAPNSLINHGEIVESISRWHHLVHA